MRIDDLTRTGEILLPMWLQERTPAHCKQLSQICELLNLDLIEHKGFHGFRQAQLTKQLMTTEQVKLVRQTIRELVAHRALMEAVAPVTD
jgi:hypothetical protein